MVGGGGDGVEDLYDCCFEYGCLVVWLVEEVVGGGVVLLVCWVGEWDDGGCVGDCIDDFDCVFDCVDVWVGCE